MISDFDIVIGFRSVDGFRTEEYLERCIASVEQFTPTRHRWIFVDDHSDEVGAKFVDSMARQFRDSVLIRTYSQNWFSRAHNKGLRLVRTQKAMILNSDTFVGEGWLEEMCECWMEVERDAQQPVGMVGSVFNRDIQVKWSMTRAPNYVTMHAALLDVAKCFEVAERRGTPGEIFDTTCPSTIHIRSDVDLSHRLNDAGYLTIASYKSVVEHHGGRSWGYLLGTIPGLEAVNGL